VKEEKIFFGHVMKIALSQKEVADSDLTRNSQ
jgi:hypothetical protein